MFGRVAGSGSGVIYFSFSAPRPLALPTLLARTSLSLAFALKQFKTPSLSRFSKFRNFSMVLKKGNAFDRRAWVGLGFSKCTGPVTGGSVVFFGRPLALAPRKEPLAACSPSRVFVLAVGSKDTRNMEPKRKALSKSKSGETG
jgi:hypothetical protein